MKKLIIACGVVALAAFTTSCKKEYTCECKDDGGDVVYSQELPKSKKGDAESACNVLDSADRECELK